MQTLARLIILPVIAVVLSMTPAQSADLDRTDPAAVAVAFLNAFKAKDVIAMAPLSNETNREMFTSLAAEGEAHKAYNDVFSGWRFDSAVAWDGTVQPTRYKENGEAVVAFHQMPDDEVAVIVLTKENGIWGIEDINSPSNDQLMSLSTTPPQ